MRRVSKRADVRGVETRRRRHVPPTRRSRDRGAKPRNGRILVLKRIFRKRRRFPLRQFSQPRSCADRFDFGRIRHPGRVLGTVRFRQSFQGVQDWFFPRRTQAVHESRETRRTRKPRRAAFSARARFFQLAQASGRAYRSERRGYQPSRFREREIRRFAQTPRRDFRHRERNESIRPKGGGGNVEFLRAQRIGFRMKSRLSRYVLETAQNFR